MSSYITLIVFAVVIIGLLTFSTRARRRQAAVQTARAEQISVGSEVMTTSGLYGTVTARNDDDSVQLSIAPGVEVRWAVAALREVAELPDGFRGDPAPDTANEDDDWSGAGVRLDKSSESGSGSAPGQTGPATRP